MSVEPPPQRAGTATPSPDHDKAAHAAQAIKGTAAIALRAYELYRRNQGGKTGRL